MTVKTITGAGLRLVLDSSEIDNEDPGNGTPAMVYGTYKGKELGSTFYCALDTGELDGIPCLHEGHYQWLLKQEQAVDAFMEEHS